MSSVANLVVIAPLEFFSAYCGFLCATSRLKATGARGAPYENSAAFLKFPLPLEEGQGEGPTSALSQRERK
jgi:hypothetical protein